MVEPGGGKVGFGRTALSFSLFVHQFISRIRGSLYLLKAFKWFKCMINVLAITALRRATWLIRYSVFFQHF